MDCPAQARTPLKENRPVSSGRVPAPPRAPAGAPAGEAIHGHLGEPRARPAGEGHAADECARGHLELGVRLGVFVADVEEGRGQAQRSVAGERDGEQVAADRHVAQRVGAVLRGRGRDRETGQAHGRSRRRRAVRQQHPPGEPAQRLHALGRARVVRVGRVDLGATQQCEKRQKTKQFQKHETPPSARILYQRHTPTRAGI